MMPASVKKKRRKQRKLDTAFIWMEETLPVNKEALKAVELKIKEGNYVR